MEGLGRVHSTLPIIVIVKTPPLLLTRIVESLIESGHDLRCRDFESRVWGVGFRIEVLGLRLGTASPSVTVG